MIRKTLMFVNGELALYNKVFSLSSGSPCALTEPSFFMFLRPLMVRKRCAPSAPQCDAIQ
jgi:hypothetical protein